VQHSNFFPRTINRKRIINLVLQITPQKYGQTFNPLNIINQTIRISVKNSEHSIHQQIFCQTEGFVQNLPKLVPVEPSGFTRFVVATASVERSFGQLSGLGVRARGARVGGLVQSFGLRPVGEEEQFDLAFIEVSA